MPKRCTDPRCPLNKTINNLQRDFCKIHGRPYVSFAFDDTRERGRRRLRSNRAREVTKRDCSNLKYCKNKKCQTAICTTERSTSTNSRSKIQSHASGKSGMHFHRHIDKGRPCECRHKRCCKGKESTTSHKKERRSRKRIRRYRSRRKRKKKYGWLRNCLRRFCICAKTPSSIPSSECCCTYADKYGETSTMSNKSRKLIFPANNETWREDNRLIHQCHCMNSIEKRLMPRDQSYLQGALSRGLDVMRRGINWCI